MAMKLYSDSSVQAIANAIRSKNGESTQYKIADMAQAILDIPSGGGSSDLAAFIQRTISGDFVNEDVTTVGQDAFNGCKSLSSISLPNCIQVQTRGLDGTSASAIYLPRVRNLNAQSVIAYNTNLINMVLPALATNIGQYGMQGCTKLQACDLGKNATGLNTQTFSGCTVLSTLILRRTSAVATLSNTNVFTNSPFASGKAGGTLYVPQALISSYQSATNWSSILGYTNNQISPIELSVYKEIYADDSLIDSTKTIPTIKVFKGKGTGGTNYTQIVDLESRALTAPIPFVNGDLISVHVQDAKSDGISFTFKNTTTSVMVIDSSGGNAVPYKNYGTEGGMEAWSSTDGVQIFAKNRAGECVFDTTTGYCRLMFANLSDKTTAITPSLNRYISVQGTVYRMVEADASEFE